MILRAHALVFLFLAVSGLSVAADCAAQDVLRLHGTHAMGERVAPILVGSWMGEIGYRDIRSEAIAGGGLRIRGRRDGETLDVEIVGNGNGAGFQDLVEGKAELAMMSRPLSAREIDDAWQLGKLDSPDQEFVVGLQALVAVVHPDNPLRALSPAQLAQVMSGRIRDWRELGGKPGPIHVQRAAPGTGLAQMQAQLLVASAGPGLPDARAIVAAVRTDPLAIGVVEFGRRLEGSRPLALRVGGRDIPADRLHVQSEDYPLSRRLQFRAGQLVTALGRSFVNYAVSAQGQQALARRGFLAFAPTTYPAQAEPDLGKDYAALVAGAVRLPVSLRFGDAFSILDSRSTQELARLKAFLDRPENRRRKLVLIGLCGRYDSPIEAETISTERADLAAHALGEVGLFPVRVRGLGHQRPLAGTAKAQARDLRVELWLR